MKINTTIKFRQTNWFVLVFNILLFQTYSSVCNSQDLYNIEQSQKYADYLFSSRQFNLAAEEYERLLYFDEHNDSFKNRLIRSYRFSGDINTGISRIYSLSGDSIYTLNSDLAKEFVALQLLSDSLTVAGNFINRTNSITAESRVIFQSFSLVLKGDYESNYKLVRNAADKNIVLPKNILALSEAASKTKLKSPFLAGSFSAIIPGSGKMYTKNYTDGIISFLFVAANAWQASRGFKEAGIKSGYGWVFTGLSASFYMGNIVGSVKAARRYNKIKKNEIDNQVYEIIHSDSF